MGYRMLCGVQDAMPAAPIKRQADTTHLGQTQFRHIMKASFSPRMFPGETAIIRVEKKRINIITSKIPTIIQATVDCYAGSCKNCRRHALVLVFSASLPKNVNFSRNAQGRVCSVIDRIKYGAGNSMVRKLENVKYPITKGGSQAHSA